MTTSDFYNFKELANKYAKRWIQKEDGSTIIWRHVRILKVIKGFPGKIWIKRSHIGDYELLDPSGGYEALIQKTNMWCAGSKNT